MPDWDRSSGRGERWTVSAEPGNVADLLAEAARVRPGGTALIDTALVGTEVKDTYTWAEFDAAVNGQARRFAEAGLRQGDRVAVQLPTSAAFAVTFFAVVRAGGIAVPVSPQAPAPEIDTVLSHSGATLLVTEGDGREGVQKLEPGFDAGEPVPAIGAGEDIAVLSYTSGTTGPQRGVMLSHRALLANVNQLQQVRPPALESGDRALLAIPLFHVYGLGPGLLLATAAGATVVLAPRFDARKALEQCAEHRITALAGVPAMYVEFAALPPDELGEGLSTVGKLTSGAAPLHPKVLAAIRQATGIGVYEGYGLTETAPVVTSTLVTGYPKPGSVGRPLPGVEVRLVEPDGDSEPVLLDPDELDDTFEEEVGGTGLVAVRGANLFSGYWPDGAHGPDAEGWFRTGDVGYLDVDGDLHLVDRANDLIIVNGFNVYPREVETAVGELPEVAEAAVVGVLDDRSGEAVKAVVVTVDGASLSEQQVVDHCATRLAGYKVPRTVEFVTELPRSPTGKLRRVRLR